MDRTAEQNTYALVYEMALRNVHLCGRTGEVNADVFRAAEASKDWAAVASALSRGIEAVSSQHTEPSTKEVLRMAAEALSTDSSPSGAYAAISHLVDALWRARAERP